MKHQCQDTKYNCWVVNELALIASIKPVYTEPSLKGQNA